MRHLRHAGLPVSSFGVLALLALAPPAAAHWDWIGPEGGAVKSFVFDPAAPGSVYAATDFAGVWRSTDGGASWAPAGPGIVGQTILALAVDPGTPSSIYAGTDHGLFRSMNGGATWVDATGDLPHPVAILTLAVGNSVDPTLYAEVQVGSVTSGDYRLYRSDNRAASWIRLDQGLPSLPNVLVPDPAFAGHVYAVTRDGQLWRSNDAGTSWGPGGPQPAGLGPIYGLAVAPAAFGDLGTLFATPVPGSPDHGIYASDDGGTTWRLTGLPREANAVVPDPSHLGTLYATVDFPPFYPPPVPAGGVQKSTDGGATWTVSDTGIPGHFVHALAVDPNDPARLVAGYLDSDQGAGIAQSGDGATSWAESNHGFRTREIFQVATDHRRPGTLYAGIDGDGLYKTRDGGTSWQLIRQGTVGPILLDQHRTATIYASLDKHLSRSLDAGATWTPIEAGLPSYGLDAYALDPDSGTLWTLFSQGLYKSADRGASWSLQTSALPASGGLLAVDRAGTVYVAVNEYLYIGPPPHAFVLRSTDGGATFSQLTQGIPDDAFFTQLAVDPKSSAVYLSSQLGVFVSTDQGASWAVSSVRPQDPAWTWVSAVLPNPLAPGTIYAGTQSGFGVFRSLDGGRSWVPLGRPLQSWVLALALDQTSPGTLYAAGYGGLLRFRPGL